MGIIRGEKARRSSGAPGYALKAMHTVGGCNSLRAGNPPNFGHGYNVAAKPMSQKKKTTQHGPAAGFLSQGLLARGGDEKADVLGTSVLIDFKLPLRKIIHDSLGQSFEGQSMYDPKSMRFSISDSGELILEFKTNPEVLRALGDQVMPGAENITYRINLAQPIQSDYKREESATDVFRSFFDVKETEFGGVKPFFNMQNSNLQSELFAYIIELDDMDYLYQLECSIDGSEYQNVQVYGATMADGSTLPITGDLDPFALMTPMDSLIESDDSQLVAKSLDDSVKAQIANEIETEVSQLMIGHTASTAKQHIQQVDLLMRAKVLYDQYADKYLTAQQTGYATDYEFTVLSKLIAQTFIDLSAHLQPEENTLANFVNTTIEPFLNSCAAIFQHGPETNNPGNPSSLDEEVYWAYDGEDYITEREDDHIKFLITAPNDSTEAPCTNHIIKIHQAWDVEKWQPVYDFMRASWEKRFIPTLAHSGEGSKATLFSSSVTADSEQDQKTRHMAKFDHIMGEAITEKYLRPHASGLSMGGQ